MDIFLFGPLAWPALRFFGNRFGLRTVGGMRSDLLGLMLAPLTLTARFMLADDEDEEFRWSTLHIMKHSMLGWGPTKLIDWSWALIDMIVNNDEGDTEDFIHKSVDPAVPFRGIGAVKDVVKAVTTGKAPPRY